MNSWAGLMNSWAGLRNSWAGLTVLSIERNKTLTLKNNS